MFYAILADDKGTVACGTDSVIPLDGRWNMRTIREKVAEYRNRFKNNFPHKYNSWKKFGIVQSIRENPTEFVPIG